MKARPSRSSFSALILGVLLLSMASASAVADDGRRLGSQQLAVSLVEASFGSDRSAGEAEQGSDQAGLWVRARVDQLADWRPAPVAGEQRGIFVEAVIDGAPHGPTSVMVTPVAHEVMLVLDVSGSMAGAPLAALRDAAVRYVEALPADVRVGVVTFSTSPRLLVPLSTDRDAVRRALATTVASGRTALYDAVAFATEVFRDGASSSDANLGDVPARSMVVFADGEDNASATAREDLIADLAAAGVAINTVELVTSFSDREAMEQLSAVTGGVAVQAREPDELEAVVAGLPAQRSAWLQVTIEPPEPLQASKLRVALAVAEHGGPAAISETLEIEVPPSSESVSHNAPVAAGWQDRAADRPSGWIFLAGVLLVVGGLLAEVLALIGRRPRIDAHRLGVGANRSRFSGAFDKALGAAEGGLERSGRWGWLAGQLERAGVGLTPGRYLVHLVARSLVVGMLVALVGPIWLVPFAMIATVVAARFVLAWRTDRRQAQFADQLDDTLQLLAGSLRAGHSLLQAIDTVAKEADAPTNEEFRRIVASTRVGVDLGLAFDAAVARTGSDDLNWVAQAIEIHREVGGNLASVLDSVAGTIRERNQIRRQVKALSAEGKLSALVLMSLPVGILAFLALVQPDHLRAFTESLLGLIMLASTVCLLLVGGLWLRKIVRIEF